jgi:hypothetical protein
LTIMAGTGLTLHVGGAIDPSLDAALNQSVARAKAAGLRAQATLRTQITNIDKRLSNIDPIKGPSAEASALVIQRATLQRQLLRLHVQGAEQRLAATAASEAEQVAANKLAMAKIISQEREAGIAYTAEQQMEAEAAAVADSEKVASNRLALDLIVAQERKAGLDYAAEQQMEAEAHAIAEAEKLAATKAAQVEKLVLGRSRLTGGAQGYLAEAAAAQMAGFSTGKMAGDVLMATGTQANFNSGINKSITILRQLAAGNYSKAFLSATGAIQKFGASLASVLLSLPGLVAVAAIAVGYVLVRSFHAAAESAKDLQEKLSRTHEIFRDGADALNAHHEAMLKNISAAEKYNDWLKKLGASEETITDQLDVKLKAMRDEAAIRKQIATEKGASPKQSAEMEQEQRRKELALETDALAKAKKAAEDAKQEGMRAEAAATEHETLLDKDAGKKDFDKTIAAVEELDKRIPETVKAKIKANQAIIDAQQAREDDGEYTGGQFLEAARAKRENSQMKSLEYGKQNLVGIGDSKANISPDQVEGIYHQAMARRALELKWQEDLQKEQGTLDAAKTSTQGTATERATEVKGIQKRVDERNAEVALHDKYDSQLSDKGKTKTNSSPDVTAREKVGLGAVGQTPLLDVNRSMDRSLKILIEQGRHKQPGGRDHQSEERLF